MNKLYSVHDHWTDINKKNDVDIESIDGVITGIKVNGEDYGGSEYQNIYDNTINTVLDDGGFYTTNIDVVIEADSIIVTFDGVEYNCPKRSISGIGTNFYGASTPLETEEGFNWTDFPFSIVTGSNASMVVTTQTAGSHTLKIDIPQSGGSSDFSTAEVTVVNNTGELIDGKYVSVVDTPISTVRPMNTLSFNSSRNYIVPLYKGSCYWTFDGTANVSVSGDIEWNSENRTARITGDCTITIS